MACAMEVIAPDWSCLRLWKAFEKLCFSIVFLRHVLRISKRPILRQVVRPALGEPARCNG